MPAADPKTRFPFTEPRIRDLPLPGVGRVRYKDAGGPLCMPGLCLYASPKGKVFYYYGKSEGRPVEIRLGGSPAMTVETARTKIRTEIIPNPAKAAAAVRARKEAQSLGEAWAGLLANPYRKDGKGALRPGTLRSYTLAWGHLTTWAGRALDGITPDAVIKLRDRIQKTHGPARCRQVLALLTVLMGGRMPRDTNGRAIKKPEVEPRRRYFDAIQLGALLRGLDAEAPLWRVFWLCCVLAPLRQRNIANAKWLDLNLEPNNARWIVAASEAKGRHMLAMPIPEGLASVLRSWRVQNPKSVWVFPSGLTGSPARADYDGPIVSVAHAWRRALLLGEAVALCDAVGLAEGKNGRAVFAAFLENLKELRIESWEASRDRRNLDREGTPLARAVELLRKHAKTLGIDPAAHSLAGLVPHDLRRTAASWAVQGGASIAMVAASLGHADSRTAEKHYAHLSDDPIRRMLTENAGRVLATVQEVKP